jgi:hypothetical protein
MTKSKAIKLFCFDCAGECASDVTFCQIKDCQLWPFRLGSGVGTKCYARRIEVGWGKRSEAANAARDAGLDIGFFKISSSKTSVSGTKRRSFGKITEQAA